jgi:hypothetical protein
MVYLHTPTHTYVHISEFVPYGMNLLYNKNRIGPIFVCRDARHLANMSDCVNGTTSVRLTTVCLTTFRLTTFHLKTKNDVLPNDVSPKN